MYWVYTEFVDVYLLFELSRSLSGSDDRLVRFVSNLICLLCVFDDID